MRQMKAGYEETLEDEFDDALLGVEEVDEDDSDDGFPAEHMQPLRGLLFTGALSKNFMYAGHDFLIETLTEGDLLRIGQLMATYRGTFSEVEAKKCFTVAACVQAVDGYSLVTDIAPNQSNLSERIEVVKKWYPPVVDYVYRRYLELESTEFAVAASLKK